jgi:hypothetical protein
VVKRNDHISERPSASGASPRVSVRFPDGAIRELAWRAWMVL